MSTAQDFAGSVWLGIHYAVGIDYARLALVVQVLELAHL